MLWINLTVAALGLIATIAAFGGDTWKPGNQRFVARVTVRGWISMASLVLAFLVGVGKEIRQQIDRDKLEQQNREQATQIQEQVTKISELQSQIAATAEDLGQSATRLGETTEQIGERQLASIEAAFRLAIRIPRETDDAVVHLRGQDVVRIPSRSRYFNSMKLYWGDQFHFVIMRNDVQASELSSLRLEVGGRSYPLHDGQASGLFEETLRIYGTSPEPMEARIMNPDRLNGVSIKIFVSTTDSSQGQSEFRRLILSSPFAAIARRIYKTTTADVVNMRSSPLPDAPVLSRLARGSFVRRLQESSGWTEVLTPEGRQGWIATDFIGEIQ